MNTLLAPYQSAPLNLQNRVVMSPMTRSRAIGNTPNALMAQYYGQRSGAGLIITEGTSPSPNGLGYPRIPGAYSAEQTEGWKAVTAAAHKGGAKIFLQLMHTGRVGHIDNLPEGSEVLSPSAATAPGEMYVDGKGPQPHTAPRVMSENDIHHVIEEYATAARNAVEAGFDGVEIHGANGYLVEQFINPLVNDRNDGWGGSDANRIRFAVEVTRAIAEAIGPERTGIRLSPYGVFNGTGPFDTVEETFEKLAAELDELGVAYVHLVNHEAMGAPEVPRSVVEKIRKAFSGTLILSGGYELQTAEADLKAGIGDLIAFGRPFIANPDLVDRFRKGAELNTNLDMNTFYTPGPEGYTDYPALSAQMA